MIELSSIGSALRAVFRPHTTERQDKLDSVLKQAAQAIDTKAKAGDLFTGAIDDLARRLK